MSSIKEFIKKYNLQIDLTRSYGKIVYIRSSICTEEEAELFVKKFSHKTQTIWTVQYGNYRPKKVVYHKAYVCHRSGRKNKYLLKNLKCGASLDVKVKKVNRSTLKNDPFLKKELPLPCVIRLHYEHNHDCKEDLKYLRISDEIKDIFFGYFDNGLGVAKALKLYEDNPTTSEGAVARRSPRLAPTTRQIYYLYTKWLNKKRVASVVCEDSEDYLSTMEVEDLVNAIPRVDPHVRYAQKPPPLLPKPSNESVPVISNNVQPMPRPQMTTPNMSQLKNLIVHSRMLNSNPTLQKIFIVKGSMPNQHISVNSPNHLNGSILTVVNSRSAAPLIPSLLNTQSSAVMPQITSVMSLEANVGSSSKSPVPVALIENNSEPPSVSSSVNQQMSFESYDDTSEITILPDYPISPSEIKVEDISEDSEQNMPVLTPNTECSTDSASNLVDADLSLKVERVSPNEFCPPELNYQGASSVSCLSSSYITKLSSSQASTTNTTFLDQDVTNSSIDTQITNTVHQSGAQVSVKSPVQSAPITIVSAMHLSELQAKDPLPVDEPIKIKEEPPDEYETSVMETQTSSNLPTIENITSLSTITDFPDGAVALSQIKVETNENDVMVTDSITQTDDILPSMPRNTAPVNEDEDYQFLMSLLPEFKRIPKDAKVNLKSQIQSLLLTARLNSSRKRSQDVPITNAMNKIYAESKKRHQDINPINKIYHDCRTLISFPTLK